MSTRVETSRAGERTVYHLIDDSSGASASILPSYGFNLFDLQLPSGNTVRPIVVAAPGWAENPGRPARNGFPILFPFAGRIRDARFSYRGQEFSLVANKPPHAIHGFAYDAPWDVVDHSVIADGASLCGRFQISKNAPQSLDHWPADAILEVRYTLAKSRLTMTSVITNPSSRVLPWGFGLHSYFALPMDRREDLAGTQLIVPADRYWLQKESLPTGERNPVANTGFDFRSGRSMSGLDVDLALTDLNSAEDNVQVCRLVDERVGAEILLRFDRSIRQFVLFTPPGSPGVVAVEPYTAMADPFSLRKMGVDSGLHELDPGDTFKIELGFESRAIQPSNS